MSTDIDVEYLLQQPYWVIDCLPAQVPTSSTCMALHNPTPRLLDEARALAAASGLFVWRPDEH